MQWQVLVLRNHALTAIHHRTEALYAFEFHSFDLTTNTEFAEVHPAFMSRELIDMHIAER